MSCRRQRARLFAAVDGALTLDERFELDAHLESCARCRELARALDVLDSGFAALSQPPIEHLDLETQLRAIHERGAARARPLARPRTLRVAAAAALVVGTALGALWLARRGGEATGRAVEPRTADDASCMTTDAPAGASPAEPSVAATDRPERGTRAAPAESMASSIPARRDDAAARDAGARELAPPNTPDASAAASSAAVEAGSRDEPDARSIEELARRSAARQRLAEVLVATWTRTKDAERDALSLAFADATRELAREGIPIARVAADLADSTGSTGPTEGDDLDVARAALRYLGTQAGRVELRSVERALKRPELHDAAALALVDLGEAGAELVARECTTDADPTPLFARLSARGDRDAAASLERCVRELASRARSPRESTARRALLAARADEAARMLARHAGAGVESLLRLARDGSLAIEDLGALLALAPGGRERIDELLRAPKPQLDPRVTLQAVASLRPPAGVDWLYARALETRNEQAAALGVLADYGDGASLRALLRLKASGRVESTRIEAALDQALERGPDSAAELARELAERRDRVGLAQLFDELARAPRAAHVRALLEIARAELLPDVERRAALELATEFGSAGDCVALAELFRALPPRERELRAATIVALHRLGGRAALERVFAREAEARVTRLVTLLEAPGASTRLSNTLFRVARELDAAADTLLP